LAVRPELVGLAIACGFKTQQHFARVFRKLCGASPTEYREEFVETPSGYAMEDGSHDTPILASAGLGQVNNSARQA